LLTEQSLLACTILELTEQPFHWDQGVCLPLPYSHGLQPNLLLLMQKSNKNEICFYEPTLMPNSKVLILTELPWIVI